MAAGVFVDEIHDKLPTLYWLPKLHKRPYKSRFIADSSSCTTAELSILLTSCLTTIKILKKCMRGMVKFYVGLSKIPVRFFINKNLSSVYILYDFSTVTLNTILPHNHNA